MKIHWYYGVRDLNMIGILLKEIKRRKQEYCLVDYMVQQERYEVIFSTVENKKWYIGIIPDFFLEESYKRLKHLYNLFEQHPMVEQMKWNPQEVYVISDVHPLVMFNRFQNDHNFSREEIMRFFIEIKHLGKVIELPCH